MPSALSPHSRLLAAALLTACGTDPAKEAPGSEVDSAAPPPAEALPLDP